MKQLGLLVLLCLTALSFAPTSTLAAQEIKPFVRGSYQQIISARQGKPFIISFWSLSCGHCMDEMATLKKLAKKYSRLDLVLVSTDTPEEKKSVTAALARFSPRKAETWLFAESYTDPLYFEIDKKWHGELPRTYFFNAKNEVTAISGKLEYEEVEQWVREQYAPR